MSSPKRKGSPRSPHAGVDGRPAVVPVASIDLSHSPRRIGDPFDRPHAAHEAAPLRRLGSLGHLLRVLLSAGEIRFFDELDPATEWFARKALVRGTKRSLGTETYDRRDAEQPDLESASS